VLFKENLREVSVISSVNIYITLSFLFVFVIYVMVRYYCILACRRPRELSSVGMDNA